MKCRPWNIGAWSALAKSAAYGAHSAFGRGLLWLGIRSASEGTPGPVATMPPKSEPAATNIDLTARAVRLCNRDPILTRRYLEKHLILMGKGA